MSSNAEFFAFTNISSRLSDLEAEVAALLPTEGEEA